MNTQFTLLQGVLLQWRMITSKKLQRRTAMMKLQHKQQSRILKCVYQSWLKQLQSRIRYRKRRDIFYQKLLIFNYRYILKKYFNAFKYQNQQLVTQHYQRERINKFKSQLIHIKLGRVFKMLHSYSIRHQNEKMIVKQLGQTCKQKYLCSWIQCMRRQQLNARLNSRNGELNEIEQWILNKRNNRTQPKMHIVVQQEQPIQPIQPQYITPQKYQTPQPTHDDPIKQLDLLNQYLQLKVMELEYINQLPNKQTTLISTLKQEIRQTLQRIQDVKASI